ncbi:MAG: hypothetical protein KBH14_11435 [Vicinamibacteria bacterium]|jgi:hypothetical protein|nr:hypothetical protein [Vicinamibacteria bacterium]MBP9947005.1 hypothetical protein [Vicinamibacteria bacterium]
MPRATLALSVSFFSAFLVAGCGSSTPSAAPSSPTVVTPGATPAPTPSVAQPSSSLPASCRNLPVATGTNAGCRMEPADFLRQVTDAVSAAQGATVTDPDSGERYALVQDGLIQSPNAYLKMVVETLDRQGVCAVWDGEELSVRTSSGYNELFDIITGTGSSWIKYMSTCTPATPLPAIVTPPVQDSECRLAPSRDTYCDRPASVHGGDVVSALDELIAQDRLLATPRIFNFSDRQAGIDQGFKVIDTALYFSEMRTKLRSRGHCSIRGGDDEVWVKKGTNRLSEHWDLLTASGHSLRVMAAACHDAAF